MKVKYATIIVRSMDESIAFYSDVMGFAVDSQYRPRPGIVITLMKGAGEAMVELWSPCRSWSGLSPSSRIPTGPGSRSSSTAEKAARPRV